MLTDPIVLARLYLVGQQVFIYSVKSTRQGTEAPAADLVEYVGEPQTNHQSASRQRPSINSATGAGRLYVLPYQLPESGSDGDESGRSGRYELVGSTSASLLPWTVLVNCG
ncbi:hypothetical protein Gpo141_00012441 [Globisporangium polare]